IVEDVPSGSDWHIMLIDKNGQAKLVPADGYAGLNNYALVEKLKGAYGQDIGVLSIGLAGERGYRNSSVQCTDAGSGHPSRAAARGGLGSLMGSKNLKAVVIQPAARRQEFAYADRAKFNEANKKIIDLTTAENGPSTSMTKVGTINLIENFSYQGLIPVHNYSGELYDAENMKKVNGAAFLEKLKQNGGRNGLPCQPGCTIRCSNIYNDSQGKYVTSALEYETVAMLGPNCDIADLDYIAEADQICDDIGVDTIETGATIGVCMEAGKIPWGDTKAALTLLKEMVDGTEFGKLMGQGTETVGKKLGVKRLPVVKGQSLSAYEPRNAQIIGVTFAKSTMGADHTAGAAPMGNGDMMTKTMRITMSGRLQANMATSDNFMCMYGFMPASGDQTILPGLMAGAYGGDWTFDKVIQIGRDTLDMERKFNEAAGFTLKDDVLPEFFYKEVAPSSGAIFDLSKEDMADTFK
ncbi:MAG: aldehyde ferredoxin oxidoreductase C-terminal domain-containing protein, partial [Dehalococcoidales bacterium]|nr:aldehyde ferredoxin oxidoreductase C-terminal domain-containing protein [Dehalococcoidales bacterium]